MSSPEIFLDSSALFAAAASTTGAAHQLLLLSEQSRIVVVVSEQVIVETEHALARKRPGALPAYQELLRALAMKIVLDPPAAILAMRSGMISHEADLPILVAAMEAQVDYLVTLNRRHFIDDPRVAERSGLQIGTPGDALHWVRGRLGASPAAPRP